MIKNKDFNWAEKEAQRDSIPNSARAGEIANRVGILLSSLFFYAHQAWSTGFFTPAFGIPEALALYGAILLGVVGPVARMVTGSRNSARVPDICASLFWILGSIILLVSFPFNFTHFGDVLPDFLRFLVSWVSNDIGLVLFALGTAGGIAFTSISAILYLQVRKILKRTRAV